jgi:hypothetical protein
MYDHIPASLYRNILVETDGRKYRVRISEGEMSESQPYVHVEKRRRSRLYREKSEATEAAEMLYKKSKAIGWHVYSRASFATNPSDAQYRRHAEGPVR